MSKDSINIQHNSSYMNARDSECRLANQPILCVNKMYKATQVCHCLFMDDKSMFIHKRASMYRVGMIIYVHMYLYMAT